MFKYNIIVYYMQKFKNLSLNQRQTESTNIMKKYPEKIPILVYKTEKSSQPIPDLDKNKFLVTRDLTIGQFLYIIRKRLKLESTKALFIFTEKGIIPVTHDPISVVYENHKNEDGFLYFQYSSENTFG